MKKIIFFYSLFLIPYSILHDLQTDFIGRHESSYKMHYAKIEMNRIGKNRKEKKERISKKVSLLIFFKNIFLL